VSKPSNPASLLEVPPDAARGIVIRGSTGAIGVSTLKIVAAYPERFSVVSIAAGADLDLAFEQGRKFRPRVASMANEQCAAKLRERLKDDGFEIPVVYGAEGAVEVATHAEANFVVSAIVGVAGLEATYEAVKAGKTVGLANKECLVAAGELITAEARKQGKPLLPIDSEHNAVHQCMRGGGLDEVTAVWLTSSGGHFLNSPAS